MKSQNYFIGTYQGKPIFYNKETKKAFFGTLSGMGIDFTSAFNSVANVASSSSKSWAGRTIDSIGGALSKAIDPNTQVGQYVNTYAKSYLNNLGQQSAAATNQLLNNQGANQAGFVPSYDPNTYNVNGGGGIGNINPVTMIVGGAVLVGLIVLITRKPQSSK